MPSIMTIMNKSVREEKTEDIIYQRFEHIDIENAFKNEIEEINKKIKEKELKFPNEMNYDFKGNDSFIGKSIQIPAEKQE